QKELQAFLEKEQVQARFQSTVHNMTSMCWDKCITSTPSSRFARGEDTCLANCVGRFLDASVVMVKNIQQQRQQMTDQMTNP
ncbi:Tim10/DDP family zinc finger protein, partial [Hygrophoropsis aurantiaca]